MSAKNTYRIVVPEVHLVESMAAPSTMVLTRLISVQWKGEQYPSDEVVDSVLAGQENLRQQLSGEQNFPVTAGREISIQEKRRWRMFGWKTVGFAEISS